MAVLKWDLIRKLLNGLVLSTLLTSYAHSTPKVEKWLLWQSQTPPYYKSNDLVEHEKQLWGTTVVTDVTEAEMTVFPAQGNNTGVAVVILPGGGYEVEAIYHEGFDVAKELAHKGITAAVLKYRLPNPKSSNSPELVPVTDVRKALSLLREQAPRFEINPGKVGVLGFSAGSHLATVASVHLSENSQENPNFSMLIYGVTKLNKENQQWLQDTLYHRPLTAQEVSYNTLLNHVDVNTPPAFLVHAMDDDTCHYTESTLYAEALQKNRVPAELHLFATGSHGFGAGHEEHGTDQWLTLAVNWLTRLTIH
ncbi:alpha/beta hydrolase [Thalassotalea sp. PS06]|nr:alpha/beta hydrolase [Thalassotalea sp. PS06]